MNFKKTLHTITGSIFILDQYMTLRQIEILMISKSLIFLI